MNRLRFVVVASLSGIVCVPQTTRGIDLTAHFWLSNSLEGPDAPTTQVIAGDTRRLALWGRPAADENLQGFALNLVAMPEDAFQLQDLLVVNPSLPTPNTQRFQTTFDSLSGLPIYQEGTYGFNGFTVLNNVEGLPNGAGVGPACNTDTACFGMDADTMWLLGVITYQAAQAGATSDLYLQISKLGVLHTGGTVESTLVSFGTPEGMPGAQDVPLAYVPPGEPNEPAGFRDARFAAMAPAAAGQTNWNAGGAGPSQWHNNARWSLGIPTTLDTAVIDVVQADPIEVATSAAARQTRVRRGRLHVANEAALDSPVNVQLEGQISGGGWVMGDLVLNPLDTGGTLVIAQEQPLHVLGRASVEGAQLDIDNAFRPERGTTQFAILRAFDGIDGALDATPGKLALGLQLTQIWHNPYDITVEFYYESADFDDDGDVDGRDLLLLQQGWGGDDLGDANGDQLVDGADMAIWTSQFAEPQSAAATAGMVPEPSTALCACMAMFAWMRRCVDA